MNRKRKSVLLICIFVILALLPLHSRQQLYDGTSKEYLETRRLCQVVGVVGPSSALPVNSEELLIALRRIDRDSLLPHLQVRYDELVESLNPSLSDNFEMAIPVVFSPQAFISTEQNKDRKEFFIPYKEERALFDFGIQMHMSDYVFLESALPIRNVSPKYHIPYSSLDFFFDSTTHIFQHMPIVARGSVGMDMFSVYVGRTRHSFGNGFTDNLLIGDNYAFQEVFDIKFTSNIFTYNISATHFDTQEAGEWNPDDASKSFWEVGFDNPHFDGKQQSRVVHRFDVNLQNRVRLVLNLGTVYYASTAFDPRWFMPFMISHSYYNYSENPQIVDGENDEANNILSVEMDLPIYPKFNLSFQLLMDQFQIPNLEGNDVPNAFGSLLTFSFVELGKKIDYEAFIEAGYTMPFLYLAPKYNEDGNGNKTHNWNYDYYLGYYSREDGVGINPSSDGAWSGFSYGPNSVVVSLGLNMDVHPYNLKTKSLMIYALQGDINKSINEFYGEFGSKLLLGPFSHTLKLQERIYYQVLPSLELMAATELSYMHRGGKNKFGFELYMGLSWKIL